MSALSHRRASWWSACSGSRRAAVKDSTSFMPAPRWTKTTKMMIMMTTSTDGALGADDIAALEREVVALTVIGRFCLA